MNRCGCPAASFEQRDRRQAPHDRPVLAHVALLERVLGDRSGEQLAAPRPRSPRRSSGWVIVGERQAAELVGAVAEDLRELPVHVEEAAVERRDRDPDRRLVEDRAQPLLVLAQRLCRLPCGS